MSGAGARAVQVGDAPPAREYGPLTRADIVRYQEVSGDLNPIHHDEAVARAAGLPTVVSVGNLQAGILAGYCAEWLGAGNVRAFQVEFRSPVWPGDRLRATAAVTRSYEDGDERRVDLETRLVRVGSDSVAVQGRATFVVPQS